MQKKLRPCGKIFIGVRNGGQQCGGKRGNSLDERHGVIDIADGMAHILADFEPIRTRVL